MKDQSNLLRPNRAVDRLLLIETIKRLEQFRNINDYTLHAVGGPYLEDFRTFYEHFENLRMISFEENDEICKRQRFHLPYRNLNIYPIDFFDYLNGDDWTDEKGIFWLEFQDLELRNFEYFEMMLKRAATESIVKVTSKADPSDYDACKRCIGAGCSCGDDITIQREFNTKFGSLMPNSGATPSSRPGRFAELIQRMWKNAAQRAFSSESDMVFQPLSSFYYADNDQMFTLTGVLCSSTVAEVYREKFRNWRFANWDWSEPKKIEMPVLSTKEQLKLEPKLPCHSPVGETLSNELGYLIAPNKSTAVAQLESYAIFNPFYNSVVKRVP